MTSQSSKNTKFVGVDSLDHASSVIRNLRVQSTSINRNRDSSYGTISSRDGTILGYQPTSNSPTIPNLLDFNKMIINTKVELDKRKIVEDAIKDKIESYQRVKSSNTSNTDLFDKSTTLLDHNEHYDFSSDEEDNNLTSSKSKSKPSMKDSYKEQQDKGKEKVSVNADDMWDDDEDDEEDNKALFAGFVAPKSTSSTSSSSSSFKGTSTNTSSNGQTKLIQGTKDLLNNSSCSVGGGGGGGHNRMVVKPGQRIFVRANGNNAKHKS